MKGPRYTGVGCVKMKSRGSSLKFYFHQFFIQDFIFGSLWLFAGFIRVCWSVAPVEKVNPRNLVSVDDQFRG